MEASRQTRSGVVAEGVGGQVLRACCEDRLAGGQRVQRRRGRARASSMWTTAWTAYSLYMGGAQPRKCPCTVHVTAGVSDAPRCLRLTPFPSHALVPLFCLNSLPLPCAYLQWSTFAAPFKAA